MERGIVKGDGGDKDGDANEVEYEEDEDGVDWIRANASISERLTCCSTGPFDASNLEVSIPIFPVMEFTKSQTVICCRESRKAGSGGRLTLCPRSRSRAKPRVASGTSLGRESFRLKGFFPS